MYIDRALDLRETLGKKSCFFFGPRQTGKTWLISHLFPECRTYNLLDSDIYLVLSRSPGRLREEHRPGDRLIIIDEIQKLPSLLDEVHLMIESLGVHFLLTGSSARKLRSSGVNLLGGRARSRFLHPFVSDELGAEFDLLRALNNGLLPSIYFSDDPEDDLQAYAGDYLKEEIAAEGLTRNVPAFSRFLQVAALCNGRLINYSKISNDAQVARSTVQEYFSILRDTLIGYDLPCWKGSVKRKPLSTAKFYFFDPGVVRFLQNRGPVREGSPEYGEVFETFLFHELRAWTDYRRAAPLAYWRSKSGYEVDFILDDRIAIEVKATATASARDLKGLKALREDSAFQRYLLVCHEQRRREVDGLTIMPWREFLSSLWGGVFDDG
jgi:predicted AAA+ superfamily ATPase